jgi:predicted nucleic acid-binding protein
MHFLNFNPNVQSDFLKYQNVPMDLADASLLLVSEEEGINSIVTLDSDYIVYRSKKKKFKYLL